MNFKNIDELLSLAKDVFNETVVENKGILNRYRFTEKLTDKIDALDKKFSTGELLITGEFCEYMFKKSEDKENKESRWE